MEAFRTTDVISLSYVAYIMLALVLVLAAAYVILFFVSKKLKTSVLVKSTEKNIAIIETKYANRIGHICLISVSNHKYLIVNSPSGVAISPVADAVDVQTVSCQPDVTN